MKTFRLPFGQQMQALNLMYQNETELWIIKYQRLLMHSSMSQMKSDRFLLRDS